MAPPLPLRQVLRAKLSRRVALWVLGSILAIEVVIFLPSYQRRKGELIQQISTLSLVKMQTVALKAAIGSLNDPAIAAALGDRWAEPLNLGGNNLLGITVYDQDGRVLEQQGVVPHWTLADWRRTGQRQSLDRANARLSLVWTPDDLDLPYWLIAEHDFRPSEQELWHYFLRISGLVFLVSLVGTIATLYGVSRAAIAPITQLRDDLMAAGDWLAQPEPVASLPGQAAARDDEIGEVFRAFAAMYDRVRHEILERRLAEAETEKLLLNILPAPIADRLKRGEHPIAERFETATVLFADLVDFTGLASALPPADLVEKLNGIFSAFDALADHYGLEKIKTIGDAYMAVGGVPNPHPNCVVAVAEAAIAMRASIRQFQRPGDRPFSIRIGIHTGPVVAGVIGTRKFIYDLWGDTVNVASRMESQGLADHIQTTAAVYDKLKDHYHFQPRGPVSIKGKGSMDLYLLIDRLPPPTSPQTEPSAFPKPSIRNS
jgi:adenylate cyclase